MTNSIWNWLKVKNCIYWNVSHFETSHYNAKLIISFIQHLSSFTGTRINLSE